MTRLRTLAVLPVSCGLLLLPGVAFGAWSTVLDLSAHPRSAPELAGDRGGGALLAWVDFAGDGPGVPMEASAKGVLKAVRRASAGDGYGAVETPAGTGSNVRAVSSAGDGAGGVVLAWRAGGSSSNAKLRVARGTTSGGLGTPVTLTGPGTLPDAPAALGGDATARPVIALSAHGDVLVAWLARAAQGCGYVVRASVRRAGGTFSAGKVVSAGCGRAAHPRVALGADGAGAIAWDAGPSCPSTVHACAHEIITLRVTAGRFGSRAAVTRRAAPYAPALAMTGSGPIYAWRDFLGTSSHGVRGKVYARAPDRNGKLGERKALSSSEWIAGTPRLVAGEDGSVLATWQPRPQAGSGHVQIALRPPGASTFPAAESFPGLGWGGPQVASLQAGLSAAADAGVIHCNSGQRLVLSQRTRSGTLIAPEWVGGTIAIAQGPCAGPLSPAAAVAVSGTGATLVSVPDGDHIRLVERPAPIG
jgi:hypothetical protein